MKTKILLIAICFVTTKRTILFSNGDFSFIEAIKWAKFKDLLYECKENNEK